MSDPVVIVAVAGIGAWIRGWIYKRWEVVDPAWEPSIVKAMREGREKAASKRAART